VTRPAIVPPNPNAEQDICLGGRVRRLDGSSPRRLRRAKSSVAVQGRSRGHPKPRCVEEYPRVRPLVWPPWIIGHSANNRTAFRFPAGTTTPATNAPRPFEASSGPKLPPPAPSNRGNRQLNHAALFRSTWNPVNPVGHDNDQVTGCTTNSKSPRGRAKKEHLRALNEPIIRTPCTPLVYRRRINRPGRTSGTTNSSRDRLYTDQKKKSLALRNDPRPRPRPTLKKTLRPRPAVAHPAAPKKKRTRKTTLTPSFDLAPGYQRLPGCRRPVAPGVPSPPVKLQAA